MACHAWWRTLENEWAPTNGIHENQFFTPKRYGYMCEEHRKWRAVGWNNQRSCSHTRESWTVYNTGNSCLPSSSIGKIEIDSQGCLWLLTGVGLVKFLPGACDVYNVSNSGIIRNGGFSLHIDQNDWKWISTEG